MCPSELSWPLGRPVIEGSLHVLIRVELATREASHRGEPACSDQS